MDKDIKVTLKVWRQKGPKDKGQFETYQIDKINQSVSFLEMLEKVKNLSYSTTTAVKVSAVCVHCM